MSFQRNTFLPFSSRSFKKHSNWQVHGCEILKLKSTIKIKTAQRFFASFAHFKQENVLCLAFSKWNRIERKTNQTWVHIFWTHFEHIETRQKVHSIHIQLAFLIQSETAGINEKFYMFRLPLLSIEKKIWKKDELEKKTIRKFQTFQVF